MASECSQFCSLVSWPTWSHYKRENNSVDHSGSFYKDRLTVSSWFCSEYYIKYYAVYKCHTCNNKCYKILLVIYIYICTFFSPSQQDYSLNREEKSSLKEKLFILMEQYCTYPINPFKSWYFTWVYLFFQPWSHTHSLHGHSGLYIME